MPDLREDEAVLRLWALREAPVEFQQLLDTASIDAGSWIAHVPRELVDEPVIALIGKRSSTSRSLKTITLADGSRLLCCAPPSGTWGDDVLPQVRLDSVQRESLHGGFGQAGEARASR